MLLENKIEQEEIIKIEEVEASTEEVVTPKKKRIQVFQKHGIEKIKHSIYIRETKTIQ